MISVQVLQHGKVNEIKGVIKEIRRILKPKGVIFVTLCGRISNGKVRDYLIKTAKKIAPRTYAPTKGNEVGLTHFIYNKKIMSISRPFAYNPNNLTLSGSTKFGNFLVYNDNSIYLKLYKNLFLVCLTIDLLYYE